jgi:uncharacterized membrane-anchored protein YhcB (DUF1043 family)
MVNTLTAEQKRYTAGLDQFNHFRRDIAEQEAQTKKTLEKIAEVDAKLAMTRVEVEDHFAENMKRELAHTALVEGYERRCKVMQSDLEYNFKTQQEDLKEHMNASNERFKKLREDYEQFKAESEVRDQRYDALAKTVKTQLSKTLHEINDRHKKEMGAM